MNMQQEEILFEVVPGEHLQQDMLKLRKLAYTAGLLVNLTEMNGTTFLSVRYDDGFTEFVRTRHAGRPRKKESTRLTCGEVVSLKTEKGAKVVAATLGMPLATFYRHYIENKGKKEGEIFS
ncbi:MAG: hypothetical protein WCR02_09640 [Sphaerochaetaceae bacterium]